MAMKTICTVTLNPAFDQVGTTQQLTLGQVNKITTQGRYPSGKGVNVARVLASLDVPCSVTGFLGSENASEFVECFAREGIENRFSYVAGSTRTNVKIITTAGEVTDINFTGFSVTAESWATFANESLAYLSSVDYVVVSGSLPLGVAVTDFKAWLSALKQAGVKLAVDTSGAALTAALDVKPWFAKPNNHELAEFVGHELATDELLYQEGLKLQQAGIEHLVISLGEKGSFYFSPTGTYRAYPPLLETIVSTVGAGDSMVAGFIYGQYHNLEPVAMLNFATALSAFAVLQENVGERNPAMIAKLQQQVKVEQLA